MAHSARAARCRRQPTNSFFLKDRCSLSDQISFVLASTWRAFILTMRDKNRANKNEIEIFVFGVTSNDFPHDSSCSSLIKIGAPSQFSSTHAPADNRRFEEAAGIHTVPSTATPSAQKWNDIGADVIFAKKLKWLVRWRNTSVREGVNSLLPCRHRSRLPLSL